MLATALAPVIGYDAAAALAKEAYKSGRTIRELGAERGLSSEDLDRLLDPAAMTDYRRCYSDQATIHAMCEDYRAGATLDMRFDEEDRKAGRRIATPSVPRPRSNALRRESEFQAGVRASHRRSSPR